jgi:hypothetical protein
MVMMSSGVTSSSTIPLLGNIIRGKFYINYDYLAQIAWRGPYRGGVSIRFYMCVLRKWKDFVYIWHSPHVTRGSNVNDEKLTERGSQKAWSEETNWTTSSDVG